MIKEKHKIINRSGASVIIRSVNGVEVSTKALIGRASKQFNSTLALEHYRRGHFLPVVDVKSGYLCYSTPADEWYILVATYPDIINGEVCTNMSHMMICNVALNIKNQEDYADERGNIRRGSVDKYTDLKAHAQLISADLRLHDPGLYPDAEYLLYTPGIDIESMYEIEMSVLGRVTPLKVLHIDYSSFPGCALIQVKSETRV